jgi:hypothetical protein
MMDWEDLIQQFGDLDMKLVFSPDKRQFTVTFKGDIKRGAEGGHIHPSILFLILYENLERTKAIRKVRKTFTPTEVLSTLVGAEGRFPIDELFHFKLLKC